MDNHIEEKPARVRFRVYIPVPNAPASEQLVSQATVDAHIAACGEFINQRNAWFIDASLRREIENSLLG